MKNKLSMIMGAIAPVIPYAMLAAFVMWIITKSNNAISSVLTSRKIVVTSRDEASSNNLQKEIQKKGFDYHSLILKIDNLFNGFLTDVSALESMLSPLSPSQFKELHILYGVRDGMSLDQRISHNLDFTDFITRYKLNNKYKESGMLVRV